MPRTADVKKRGFIWLPPEGTISSDIKIDSVSVKTKIWAAECTRALCPEIGHFKILLDNNNEEFSETFSGDETVEFYIDRSAGTTKRFKGTVDKIFPKDTPSQGSTINVSGNHVSGELLTITVTESYSADTLISDILDDLNTTYLSGYTINYTATDITTKPTINWNNKPFWECINDLRKLIRADAYVDDDKQLNMFDENSIGNTDEAIVMGISLISAPSGIGKQSLTKRNKIIVYGEAGGLPVISVSGTGTKEEVISDSKVTTSLMAEELSASQLVDQNQEPREGEGECFMMPGVLPGDYLWYSNPPQKITEQIKLYRYTHYFPSERTKVVLQTSREVSHIFKKRLENELALQTITNPNKMTNSLNLTFDDLSELSSYDPNVGISEGKIKLTSGSEGTFNAAKSLTADATNVELQLVGSNTLDTVYQVNADNDDTHFQTIPLNTDVTLTYSGTNLRLKVTINNADTEFDSMALLSK